jgi:hypothetical protein
VAGFEAKEVGMKRMVAHGYVLVVSVLVFACSSGGGGGGDGGGGDGGGNGGLSDADLKAACDNGVTLCKNDPTYGQTFGAQDCSNIAASYAGCDATCRAKAKPIIDCQKVATMCAAFAACVK